MSSELWGFEEWLFRLFTSRPRLRESGVLIRQVGLPKCGSSNNLSEPLFGRFPVLDNRPALPVHSQQSMCPVDKASFMTKPVALWVSVLRRSR